MKILETVKTLAELIGYFLIPIAISIVAIAVALSFSGCATYAKYGDQINDMADRVEVGVGFAVKDGYIYGPLRGRLRPTEIIHPEAEATTGEPPRLMEITPTK